MKHSYVRFLRKAIPCDVCTVMSNIDNALSSTTVLSTVAFVLLLFFVIFFRKFTIYSTAE
jgi:hypothetical protein